MHVKALPALKDNFIYVLFNDNHPDCLVVDPGEAKPVIDFCTQNNLRITHILNTHHHWDHVSGNLELKKMYSAEIWGHASDQDRIPGFTHPLNDGQTFNLLNQFFSVIHCPGHTSGAITYYIPGSPGLAFTGDTLFTLGCGRLFEGTPEQMWQSLNKLKKHLNTNTLIYCGHDYTAVNRAFTDSMTGLSQTLKPNVPTYFSYELAENLFLKAPNATKFAEIRRQRDHFQLIST